MIFEQLELHEVCQHRHRTFNFTAGVNGIVGPNGSGKSNILKMAKALLTGDFSANSGNKDANICCLAPPSGPSYIEGRFRHGDHTFDIVSGLRNRRTQLRIDGGEPIIGHTKVYAELARMFGSSWRLINDYVFVDQGHLFDFIDQTQAVRAEAFQTLFGTRRSAQLYADLGGFLTDTLPVSAEVDENLADLEQQIAEALETRRETNKELRGYKDVENYDLTTDPNAALVQQHRDHARISGELGVLRQEIAAAESKVQADRRIAQETQTRVTELEELSQSTRKDVDAARAALTNWRNHARAVERRDGLQASLGTREQQLAALRAEPEPARPPQYIERERRSAYCRELDTEADRLVWLRQLLAQFARPKRPTGLVAKFYDMHDTAEQRLQEIAQQRETAAVVIKASETYDEDVVCLEQDRANAETAVMRARDLLESCPLSEAPAGDEETLQETVDTYDELLQELDGARPVLTRVQQTATKSQAALEAKLDRQTKLQEQLPEVVSAAQLLAAQEQLARVSARVQQRGELLGRLQAAEEQSQQLEMRLQTARDKAARNRRTRALREHLTTVRNAFHHSQLPHVVAAYYLELLVDEINDLLSLFEVDFQVTTDENLTFTAHFQDGRVQPASRLSGGQKVVLALAFRIRVNLMFAGELQLLCLDEPTQFLDEKNLLCVEVALGKLKELADAFGLQCLLVTHETMLTRTFDSVINAAA